MSIRVSRNNLIRAILALQDLCVDQANPQAINRLRRSLCPQYGIVRQDWSEWQSWNIDDQRRLLRIWLLEAAAVHQSNSDVTFK